MGYLLIILLAVQFPVFPSLATRLRPAWAGRESLYVVALPALTLTLVVVAHMMRMTRAAVIDVLSAPYIEMARLKGLPEWRVVLQHALPNALGADRHRRGPQPRLPRRRRGRGRGGLRLSRHGPVHGRCRGQARRAGGPGLHAGLRHHLCRPQPHGRPPRHRQPTRACGTRADACPGHGPAQRQARARSSSWSTWWPPCSAPWLAPYGQAALGGEVWAPFGGRAPRSAPTSSAATC